MSTRRQPRNMQDHLQQVEDRLKRLENQVSSRVLPEDYRWVRIGGTLYIRNLKTATDTPIA